MSNGIEKISWKQNGMHLSQVLIDVRFASQKEIEFLIPENLVNFIFQARDSEIEMHLKFNENDHPEIYVVDFSSLKPLEFAYPPQQNTENNSSKSGEAKNRKAGVFSIFHPDSNRWLTAQGWGYVQNYFDIIPEEVMESKLSVTIAPKEAVDLGAEWRVNELGWQQSDASVAISGGIHEVEFSKLPGWSAPKPQQVYVIVGMDEQVSAKYTKNWAKLLSREPFNVISVFLALFIVFLGFYYFDGSGSQSIKDVLDAKSGHTAEYHSSSSSQTSAAIAETDQAPSETVKAAQAPSDEVETNTVTSDTANVQQVPPETAEAELALSDEVETNTAASDPAKVHPVPPEAAKADQELSDEVEMNAVASDTAKAAQAPSDAVEMNAVASNAVETGRVPTGAAQTDPATSITAKVEDNSLERSITVQISPPEAVQAGARWKLQGPGGWKNSGEKISGLINIPYTVIFKRVAGWETPRHIRLVDTGLKAVFTEGNYKEVMDRVRADNQ